MVFAGLYTVDSHEHTLLRDALEKLRLNDSSFFFEPESSAALGFGFRCGFLGLLHMEIIQERLEREYELDLITTAPGVRYDITLTDGSVIAVDNPSRWPEPQNIEKIREPIITRQNPHQRGIRRRDSEAGGGEARQAVELRVRDAHAGDADLRAAAERDRAGLLRPAEVDLPRICVAGLPACRASGSRPW